MKKLFILLLFACLNACVSVSEVHKGENKVGERFTLSIEGPWNQINAPNMGPAQIWTMEGIPLDELKIYTALKDGEAINAPGHSKNAKDFKFHSKMEPTEIVALFEGMLTMDGSMFKLGKLEPQQFGGLEGFHFEFTIVRKVDNVQLSGLGYGAVSNSELFALLYTAPKMTFFPRYKPTVEQIAASARIN